MSSVLTNGGVPLHHQDAGFLSKERIIAAPGFNRWLVPPACAACP